MSEDEVARLRDDLARALGEHYTENPVPGMPPMHYAGARVVLDVLARSWTDHLPWDSADDEQDAIRQADAIIAAVRSVPSPEPLDVPEDET